ncbi:MAG: sulfatase [Rubrobacter sp.]|nr:sulfatase [Rubrobacter sp.]
MAGAALLGAPWVGLGCGSSGSRMNVILVILDSLRVDHVGAYGNAWTKTPTLKALAEESLWFTRAHPEAMPTIPARRAIHTGMRCFPFKDRLAEQKKAPVRGWLPIPDDQPTLAEILGDAGYTNAIVTDTWHQFASSMNFDRGFGAFYKIRGQENDPYRDPDSVSDEEMAKYLPVQPEEIRQYLANTQDRESEKDWFAPSVFIQGMEYLEQLRDNSPFFLVVDSYDPHEPWDPPEEYVSLYDPDGYDGLEPFNPRYGEDGYLTDQQLLRMRSLYAGEVTMADHWLGKFMEKAHDLGIMDNTLLVVISDHGHPLGEHGYVGKLHYALYPELTDTVLMVRHPEGKAAGERNNFYASTHDVAPTILSTLGIEQPTRMQGQDLSVFLNDKDPEPRPHFTLGYGSHFWTRDEQYVAFGDNDRKEVRLFDVLADPGERRDLAADESDRIERMFDEYVLGDAGGSLPDY